VAVGFVFDLEVVSMYVFLCVLRRSLLDENSERDDVQLDLDGPKTIEELVTQHIDQNGCVELRPKAFLLKAQATRDKFSGAPLQSKFASGLMFREGVVARTS
jgi:hypothetical protein